MPREDTLEMWQGRLHLLRNYTEGYGTEQFSGEWDNTFFFFFLRVKQLRKIKLHETWSGSPSCPCSYLVEPHPMLRVLFQETYSPHLLCTGVGTHLTRFASRVSLSCHWEMKYISMSVQGSAQGCSWKRHVKREEDIGPQSCYETTPMEKLLTSLLTILGKW